MDHRNSRFKWTAAALALPALLGVATVADADEGWPREITVPEAQIVVYQPQTDVLSGNRLSYRSAVSVTPAGSTEPVFGTVWIESRVETDTDTRTAVLAGFEVPRVRFPSASDEEQETLVEILQREAVGWQLEVSLDRLIETLQLAEREKVVADDLKSDPPRILVETEPAVLVSYDGEPIVATLPGSTELEQVVNTAFWIVKDPKKGDFVLFADGETWYHATSPSGPWVAGGKPSKKVRKSVPDEIRDKVEKAELTGDPPKILVATEPSELVVIEGEPEYESIEGTDLLAVSNTESDLVMETTTQRHFLLLSGRWYEGEGFQGPWTFAAADALPDSFVRIPADGDYGHLLTFVGGTQQAQEALIEAQVPQTAPVKRDATIRVTYDGDPRFEAVGDTAMSYAINTEDQVLRVDDAYYCVREAVWYTGSSPTGPWRVATEVPDEVQSIPPSSPVYNTRYVEIYESTPEVVYMGYYPGYYGSYVWGPTIVWGTGWWYRPWWGHYYYPRYSTWGFHVRYNPWYGWGFGFSYSTGRFTFGIGYGGHRGGYYGPRGYYPRYNRNVNIDNINVYRPGTRPGTRPGDRPSQLPNGNLYARPENRAKIASTDRIGTPQQPRTMQGGANNVYSDRNGDVYKRAQNGDWQKNGKNGWSGQGQRGGASSGQNLNRDYQARQRGNQRAQAYGRSGGARRGGGGRRR